MKYKCEKCGRIFDYMPDYGICHYCGGRIGVVMDVIGFIRHDPEEGDLYLFQCPRCKRVEISNAYEEICFCAKDEMGVD